MNESKETPRHYQEGLFTAISVGFFLLLVGTIFVITPNLFDRILDFFKDFKLVDVPFTNVVFPAPAFPRIHLVVYQAAEQISMTVSLFQILILALRFVIPSSWKKRSETVGNLVYWVGATYLIQAFLIDSTLWFVFWSALLMIIGVSLIARAVVMALSRI